MNLVYIHTHDTGRMISPYGYDVPTPHIMEFAHDATTFTNSFCAGPTCSPSRAALLTGTYPHQNGMLGLSQRGFSLNDYDQHLCHFLKKNGFVTCISGIQHESGWYLDKEGSEKLGYDHILTQDAHQYQRPDLYLWDQSNAKKAAEWISDYHEDKPFMLSFGMHSTHRPYPNQVDSDLDEKYVKPISMQINNEINRHDKALLMTSLKTVDKCVHTVISALKEKGIYQDTIIMLTTDHGLAMPFHKCFLRDDGIEIMLLMRVPGTQHGNLSEGLVSNVDVFPTLCDLLHIAKPDYLAGESFAQVFEGKASNRKMIFSEVNFHTSYEPIRCVRTERFKYIRYFDPDYLKLNISNMDDCKPKEFLIKNDLRKQTKDREALYDLYYDPSEKANLIDDPAQKMIVTELRQALSDFMIKTNDPLINGPIPIKAEYKVNKKTCVKASSKDPDDYVEEGSYY